MTTVNVRAQIGFSLVEILVALAIGLFLTAGLIRVFIANGQTYRVANATARMQENARLATDLLRRDIRMAGYMGCGSLILEPNNKLTDTTSFLYDFATVVEGFEATSTTAWSPPVDGSITSPLGGRDILTIRGMINSKVGELGVTGCLPAALIVPGVSASDSGFDAGNIAIAGNCGYAAIFEITGLSGDEVGHAADGSNPGNTDSNLGACPNGGTLGVLWTRSYFVRDNPAGVASLYQRDISGGEAEAAEELVEGVEDMQVLYGIDITGGDPASVDQYVPADSVTNWDAVASVRITLVLGSIEDNLAAEFQDHDIAGTTVNDRRLYRTVTMTIGVRNGLP